MKIAVALGREPAPSAVERLAFARFVRATNANEKGRDLEEIVSRRWPNDRTSGLMAKAAATPGTVGSGGWSAEIAGAAYGAFLATLAPYSAMGQIISRGLSSPFEGHGTKRLPYRASAAAPMGWTAELDAIPVVSYQMANATLTPKKMAVISIFSRELTKYSDAEKIFGEILREDAGLSLDSAYFSTLSATAARHQGLLSGVTATPFSGSDPQEILAELAGAVAAGGSGEVVFITSAERAAKFPILFPQSKAEVIGSAAVPADRVIAIDPRGLVHGFGPLPDIDVSTDGTVHMSDAPLPISASSAVADPVRSLWQTDGIGLRMFLDIAFAKRRANAVAYADGVP